MTPTVTGLRERKGGRVAVELDGTPWRVLPADAVVRTALRVGCELDRPTARELARELRRAKALAAATRSLAASSRSQRDLERHLARAGHSAAAREDAIAALERAGIVDDARLAGARAEQLARRGYGDAAIRVDLRRRFISAEIAAEAVAALEPEIVRARRLLAGQSLTAALLRRLSARGFSRDTLEEVTTAFAQEA
ncbi:MAG TPA: RecX family transcriptional regulator [Gaiellaceae bacterium]|nr:RecX family transcriptional regulator [Gaiellaceae bacterium]